MPSTATKPISDEELIQRYLDTQQNRYFEQLYERYCDKVYRKCLSFTKEAMRAEDLTHDIFLKVITQLSRFRQEAKFSTWLYSITYNYCTDQLKSRTLRQEVYPEEGWERLDLGDEDGLAELAELEATQLEQALHRLRPDEQALLLMKYQDGISIREIATLHDLTEGAVKLRLKRARDRLRQHYLEGVVFWLLVTIQLALAIRWPFR